MDQKLQQQQQQQLHKALNCPRCDSTNTKFCYYNNYSLSQPRHFCKACKRYWTRGGTLRTVPVGGGCRNKRVRRAPAPSLRINGTQSEANFLNPTISDVATSTSNQVSDHHQMISNSAPSRLAPMLFGANGASGNNPISAPRSSFDGLVHHHQLPVISGVFSSRNNDAFLSNFTSHFALPTPSSASSPATAAALLLQQRIFDPLNGYGSAGNQEQPFQRFTSLEEMHTRNNASNNDAKEIKLEDHAEAQKWNNNNNNNIVYHPYHHQYDPSRYDHHQIHQAHDNNYVNWNVNGNMDLWSRDQQHQPNTDASSNSSVPYII